VQRHGDEHRVSVVEEHDSLAGGEVGDAEAVADLQRADVERDPLRDLERQRLDANLAGDEREHAACLGAGRLADDLGDDGGLDRLVEANLLEVEVLDLPSDRVDLVLLEDRRVRRRLAVEDDVEDRVQTVTAGEHATKLALGNADRVRLLPLSVEDAGDLPTLAQAARLARPALLTLLHLQTNTLAGHNGGEV